MKKIWTIFKTDLKNMTTNLPTIIIVLGLIILPSLYAWFNIKANWDPYGATAGIKVAVVNEDEGTILLGKELNIGNEVVEELRHSNKLGWVFTNAKGADYGIRSGMYYAMITIPKQFSSDLKTATGPNPIRPTLEYVINEKSNAIAPKITASGANTLKATISENIITAVNRVLFNSFNAVGFSLEQNLPKIQEAVGGVIALDENAERINDDVEKYKKGMIKAEEVLDTVRGELPNVQAMLETTNELAVTTKDTLSSSNNLLTQIGDFTEDTLQNIQNMCAQGSSYAGELERNIMNWTAVQSTLEDAKSTISAVEVLVGNLQKVTNVLSKLLGSKVSETLNKIQNHIQSLKGELTDALELIESGKVLALTTLDTIEDKLVALEQLSEEASIEFKETIRPQIGEMIDETEQIADYIGNISTELVVLMPKLQDVLQIATEGVTKGEDTLMSLQAKLPGIQSDIHALAQKFSFFEDNNSLNELLTLLETNPELVAKYIATPVYLKEEALYPIPNYGSGMAPFYTVLAIWVGNVILVAILSTETKVEETTPRQIYLGKGLTFLCLSLIQSLVIALGDSYLLEVYLVHPVIYIGLCLINAFIFTSIIYTLASIFGNLGKGVVIILLVLQISSSGGTFPVEVIPRFFQKVSRFLPFTYAIGTLREAQGGIFYSNLYNDLFYLVIFSIAFILLGLLFKEPLEGLNRRFNEQFKASGLGE
ncbi:MAG: YhgE/Pip domain-containing protein [Clostridiales bacterium]|jgi:putative membrane protein|nr:YhgE/Pip domain-containing protein [Niameybacter sp.]MDU6360166.1 YhgE/Pip domain-containing protein [Clostridiales bacterium]